jgi:hypothetical protein
MNQFVLCSRRLSTFWFPPLAAEFRWIPARVRTWIDLTLYTQRSRHPIKELTENIAAVHCDNCRIFLIGRYYDRGEIPIAISMLTKHTTWVPSRTQGRAYTCRNGTGKSMECIGDVELFSRRLCMGYRSLRIEQQGSIHASVIKLSCEILLHAFIHPSLSVPRRTIYRIFCSV